MASAERASAGGRELRCQHCGHELFYQQSARLDRLLGGVVHLEGHWGHKAEIRVCAHCGFAHFFMAVPAEQVAEAPVEAPRGPQLVGRSCALCRERISNELDSRYCRGCGSPVHDRCARPNTGTGCPVCGVAATVQ